MIKRLVYTTYRWRDAVSRFLTRRFTKAGLLALSGLCVTAVVGIDTHQTVAYKIFTFLLVLLLVSVLFSAFYRVRLKAVRILPRFGTAGEKIEYGIRIENMNGKGQNNLFISEVFETPNPSFEEFYTPVDHGNTSDKDVNNLSGFQKWRKMIRDMCPAESKKQEMPVIPPSGGVEIFYELLPLKRGSLKLKGFAIARPDPFGLFNAVKFIPAEQSILILPKRYDLPGIELGGTRQYQTGGVSLASSIGDSEEFISMRDYRPGDPLRKIHWKSMAKTGKPIVKEY